MARTIQVNSKAFEGTGDFQPIPAGKRLRAAIYDIEETVTGPNSKTPGLPQFIYTAKITEEGEYSGREIRYNYVPLSADARNLWVLVRFAQAVGWDASEEEGVTLPDDLSDVLGTEVIIKVDQEKSSKLNPETGQPYINNRVAAIYPLRKKSPQGGGGSGGGITDPWQ